MKKFPNYLLVGEVTPKPKVNKGEIALSTTFEKERDKRIEQKRVEATQKELEYIHRNKNRIAFKPTYIPTITSYQNKSERGYDDIVDALAQFDNLLLFETEDTNAEAVVEVQMDAPEQLSSSDSKQKKKNISLDMIIGKELTPNIFKK